MWRNHVDLAQVLSMAELAAAPIRRDRHRNRFERPAPGRVPGLAGARLGAHLPRPHRQGRAVLRVHRGHVCVRPVYRRGPRRVRLDGRRRSRGDSTSAGNISARSAWVCPRCPRSCRRGGCERQRRRCWPTTFMRPPRKIRHRRSGRFQSTDQTDASNASCIIPTSWPNGTTTWATSLKWAPCSR